MDDMRVGRGGRQTLPRSWSAWWLPMVFGGTLLLLAVSCGGKKNDDYPVQVRQNFLSACQRQGSTAKLCSCSLEKLEAKYSLAEYTKLEQALVTGQRANELIDVIQSCLTQ